MKVEVQIDHINEIQLAKGLRIDVSLTAQAKGSEASTILEGLLTLLLDEQIVNYYHDIELTSFGSSALTPDELAAQLVEIIGDDPRRCPTRIHFTV